MDRAKKWPDEARAVHVGDTTASFRLFWDDQRRLNLGWYRSFQEGRNRAVLWNWQRREEAAGTYFTGD